MVLDIKYEGGEGAHHRKFTLEAWHIAMPADQIGLMLTSIAETLSRDPDAVWDVAPEILRPEIERQR